MDAMSQQYVVETPENIAFGYDVAGIGSRFLAALIDTLIQGVIYVTMLLALSLAQYAGVLRGLPDSVVNLLFIAGIVALFLVQFGYFLGLELILHGQTPGKRLFNLQVVKENGYPLSISDTVVRNLVRIIDFFPVGYGVGLTAMFLNERAKRLGDYAAGTIVVKLRDDVKLADLAETPAGGFAPDLPGIENLRPADLELIASFLRRRHELRDGAGVARTIAHAVRKRMNSPEAESYAANISNEDFLKQVLVAARRARPPAQLF